jgi:hypothetical protein
LSPNLAERLNVARHTRFTGRSEELGLFESALLADSFPFFVLHIFGPGGVGKTTLLHEYARLSEQQNTRPIYLDARDIDPSPEVFTRVLDSSLGVDEHTPIPQLFDEEHRSVILVDTYETLTPLDGWLRTHFLPQLPETVLTVFAGRNPPADAWQTDPGWQELVRTLPLHNLGPDECQAFLTKRGIPADQHGKLIQFTHGHPLALSLVAELFSQRKQADLRLEESPDVVKTLMSRFIQQVPGPAHRAALEACAQVRVMTEGLLAKMLALTENESTSESAHQLFEWLRGLSFIESNVEGIFPHDLARETLVADMRWRNPDWYVELHNRARKYYTAHLNQTSGLAQQRLMLDTVFLHRENAVIRSFFDWQTSGMVPYTMQPSDKPIIEQMVAKHEGSESAKLAAHWMKQNPSSVTVWRNSEQQPVGFVMALPLHTLTDEDAQLDPAVRSTRDYLAQNAPLHPGEVATLFRFWMSAEAYQDISPIQSLIFINVAKHYLTTPNLAFTFFPCANADFWSGILGYAELSRFSEADFEVNGKHYGVYGHDWRVISPAEWIGHLAQKEVGAASTPDTTIETEPASSLSRNNFDEAVKQALHGYARVGGLTGNPLLESRLVNGETGSGEKKETLKSQIKHAAESLLSNPKDEKLFRAIDKTYFHPAPNQEAAAELLDLPFSTYRRHLTAGIQQLTEILWQMETGEK